MKASITSATDHFTELLGIKYLFSNFEPSACPVHIRDNTEMHRAASMVDW